MTRRSDGSNQRALHADPGATIAVIGEHNARKTTLLRTHPPRSHPAAARLTLLRSNRVAAPGPAPARHCPATTGQGGRWPRPLPNSGRRPAHPRLPDTVQLASRLLVPPGYRHAHGALRPAGQHTHRASVTRQHVARRLGRVREPRPRRQTRPASPRIVTVSPLWQTSPRPRPPAEVRQPSVGDCTLAAEGTYQGNATIPSRFRRCLRQSPIPADHGHRPCCGVSRSPHRSAWPAPLRMAAGGSGKTYCARKSHYPPTWYICTTCDEGAGILS